MANFTALELKAFDLLMDGMSDYNREDVFKMVLGKIDKDYGFEGNVNEIEIEELAEHCGVRVNQIKGVLGSLSKKGYIWVTDEDEMFCPTFEGVEALIEDIREFQQ